MKKIYKLYENYKSILIIVFVYNYFWFIAPFKWLVNNTFLKNLDWFKEIIGIPALFLVFYHYFFKYYFVILLTGVLLYKIVKKPEKRTQYIIVIVLAIIYIVLWFMTVSKHFLDFPIPRIT